MPGEVERFIRIQRPEGGGWHTIENGFRVRVWETSSADVEGGAKRVLFHIAFLKGVMRGQRVTYLGTDFDLLEVSDSRRSSVSSCAARRSCPSVALAALRRRRYARAASVLQQGQMTDFDRARAQMVDNQLRTSGVTDRRVLSAIGSVPREKFVPDLRRPLAYIDEALPLGGTRKLGAPAPFAKLVQLAAIEHTDKVLDVGCATGYSAAVLAQLGESVVAVESDSVLAATARAALGELGVANATLVEGPLETAGKSKGPYDVIVVEGVLAAVPDGLLNQLKPEGRLVALVSDNGRPPVAHLFVRTGKGIAARAEFDARLPPLAAAAPRDESFVF